MGTISSKAIVLRSIAARPVIIVRRKSEAGPYDQTAHFELLARELVCQAFLLAAREGLGLGIRDEGVRLLQQIGNVRYTPMEKTDQCCGFGGTFAVKYPAISGAIVEDKVNCIAATNTDITICNDAGCTMNISGMCHRRGQRTQVIHIAELLAEALNLDLKQW